MGMVKAADLKAGMKLSAPLKDLSGRTLLKEGAELTEQYIQRIRSWGFEEVAVQGQGEAPPPPPVVGFPIAGRSYAEVAAQVERRFSRSGEEPTLARLKAAVLGRIQELVRLHGGS
ncbi:MAG TPA: hypothetical protein PK280_18005 [Planctomycetota bacterium]|nr:hypothetical protein [Planctomycetota bacterium]